MSAVKNKADTHFILPHTTLCLNVCSKNMLVYVHYIQYSVTLLQQNVFFTPKNFKWLSAICLNTSDVPLVYQCDQWPWSHWYSYNLMMHFQTSLWAQWPIKIEYMSRSWLLKTNPGFYFNKQYMHERSAKGRWWV